MKKKPLKELSNKISYTSKEHREYVKACERALRRFNETTQLAGKLFDMEVAPYKKAYEKSLKGK